MRETPEITCCSYGTTTGINPDWRVDMNPTDAAEAFAQKLVALSAIPVLKQQQQQQQQQQTVSMTRIVKVYICDPTDDVPLEKRVLHATEEKLTDLTDQELFFELPIQEVLAKHNDLRKTLRDKRASEKYGKEIFLEPVKIRDLKMQVLTVIQF